MSKPVKICWVSTLHLSAGEPCIYLDSTVKAAAQDDAEHRYCIDNAKLASSPPCATTQHALLSARRPGLGPLSGASGALVLKKNWSDVS